MVLPETRPITKEDYGSSSFLSSGKRRVVAAATAVLAVASLTACAPESKSEASTAPTTTAVPKLTAVPGVAVVPNSEHVEVSQYGADAFKDYRNASGKGGRIDIGQRILVDCVVLNGPIEAAPSANGLWYHAIGPDDTVHGFKIAGEFFPANTFWNQEPPQAPDQNHPYDASVPTCPSDMMTKVQS